MNLKIMRLLPGMEYSTIPAPEPADHEGVIRLRPDARHQIPHKPQGVTLRRGLVYSGRLRLDLYTPTTQGRSPLVVYLPGGGFTVAPRAMARRERAHVAATGYAVASVEYRTTRQKATYHEGMADIDKAITYLTDQADALGIDPERIAVWGESAGGYMASVAGLRDERIRAVVNKFGACDTTRLADGFDERMHEFFGNPRTAVHRYRTAEMNPAHHIGTHAPAFLLLHGDDDRIIPPSQTLELHDALRAAGAVTTRYLLTGAGHGHLALHSDQVRHWTSQQVLGLIVSHLDTYVRD